MNRKVSAAVPNFRYKLYCEAKPAKLYLSALIFEKSTPSKQQSSVQQSASLLIQFLVSWNLFDQNCFHDQFWREFDLIQSRNDTGFKAKVGSWQLKFINSWMSWSEHKKIFFWFMSFFSTTNGLFTLYTYCIGEKLVKCFAQKTIVLLCKSSKLIEVRWENCYWKK